MVPSRCACHCTLVVVATIRRSTDHQCRVPHRVAAVFSAFSVAAEGGDVLRLLVAQSCANPRAQMFGFGVGCSRWRLLGREVSAALRPGSRTGGAATPGADRPAGGGPRPTGASALWHPRPPRSA